MLLQEGVDLFTGDGEDNYAETEEPADQFAGGEVFAVDNSGEGYSADE